MLIRKLNHFTNRISKTNKFPPFFNFSNFNKPALITHKILNFTHKKNNNTKSFYDINQTNLKFEQEVGFKKLFLGKKLYEMLLLLKENFINMEENDKKEVLEIVKF